MKTSKQIRKEIEKTSATIEKMTAEIIALDRIDDRRAAAESKDYDTLKALREEADSNQDEIARLSDEVYLLNIIRKILQENERAAFAAEIIPIIKDICKPYEGKKLGEKTREKIREAARAQGFGFYFDSRSYCSETRNIKAYRLSEEGYTVHSSDIELYADYDTPLIDDSNTITIDSREIKNRYTYIENPRRQAKAIIKAYEEHKKATEKAQKTQAALNALLPEGIPATRNIDHLYPTIKI